MFKNLSIRQQDKKNSVKKPIKAKVIDNINKVIDKIIKIKHIIKTTNNNPLNKKTILTTVSNFKYKRTIKGEMLCQKQ